MLKEQMLKCKEAYLKTEMELSSSKRTNLHMCNNIEEVEIINEKIILAIAELKPNDHRSENKTNVTQCLKKERM